MADEFAEEVRGTAQADAAAVHAALSVAGATEEAREYLKKQSRLADLQIDSLAKKDEFELSHLRFRRFSDYARFALEVAGFLIVLLIVSGLGTMVWNAAHDRDLVVDAFSVPPDLAQTGMTGAVLAGRVLDRFGEMQAGTVGTVQGAGSYRRDGVEEVRVEIPSTGISIGELNRYLRLWLGSGTHVAGDLVRTGKGFALTVRYGAQPGSTAEGATGDLDKLIRISAEHVYAAARPYRFAEYLTRHKRFAEAEAFIPVLATRGGPKDRAVAYSAWGELYSFKGDMVHAVEKGREAVRLDPENPVARAWLGAAESNLGHDESAYLNVEAMLRLWHGAAVSGLDADEASLLPTLFTAYRDELDGNYSSVLAAWQRLAAVGWGGYDPGQHAADSAFEHDLAQARRTAAAIPQTARGQASISVPWAQFEIAWAAGDWPGAVRWAEKSQVLMGARPDQAWNEHVFLWPQWAYAMARNGDRTGAEALIAKTPTDCDICMRMRGRIAALMKDWPGAARDFAIVAARSPHTPFAETDWGEALLHKGDLDGAIAEFIAANRKGPHFADPLEMWGEALIAKNRSDLALAKFEEADKYAPNWGRLHLKWGEALFWLGHKGEAAKQFAIAAGLDLTPDEKAQLARMRSMHG